LAALQVEIRKFNDPGYFDSGELEAVKAHRAVTSAFDRERASGFAHTLGFWWSVASLEYYMGYVDNMAQQTTADLRAYATRYIVGKPHIIGVLLDHADRQQLGLTTQELEKEGTP
jgi:zinc protease